MQNLCVSVCVSYGSMNGMGQRPLQADLTFESRHGVSMASLLLQPERGLSVIWLGMTLGDVLRRSLDTRQRWQVTRGIAKTKMQAHWSCRKLWAFIKVSLKQWFLLRKIWKCWDVIEYILQKRGFYYKNMEISCVLDELYRVNWTIPLNLGLTTYWNKPNCIILQSQI